MIDIPRHKVLHLTLSEKPFEVMVTGEKAEEFRRKSKWIESRLYDLKTGKKKDYDFIKFINGYGNDKPYFICKYIGFVEAADEPIDDHEYSNGLIVSDIQIGDFVIICGEILETGNLKFKLK